MATSERFLFLLFLLLTTTIPLYAAVLTGTLRSASETLSDAGHLSMSLTLQLISNSLRLPYSPPALTIFSPPDTAFARSGQLSLSLLLYHLSPLPFHLTSLQFLPLGSTIPTLLTNRSLVITSHINSSKQDTFLSVNGVKIDKSPIFDNGHLVILAIEEFLDPGFSVSARIGRPSGNLSCSFDFSTGGFYSFREASVEVRSKGYSIVASLLDLQFPIWLKGNSTVLTIFAPVDEAIRGRNFNEFSSISLRHVVPCKILWSDLVNFEDGAVFGTYLEGYEIVVKRSGDVLLLNGVPVSFPDLYRSNWLVVHGVRGIFGNPKTLTGAAGREFGGVGKHGFFNDGDF